MVFGRMEAFIEIKRTRTFHMAANFALAIAIDGWARWKEPSRMYSQEEWACDADHLQQSLQNERVDVRDWINLWETLPQDLLENGF